MGQLSKAKAFAASKAKSVKMRAASMSPASPKLNADKEDVSILSETTEKDTLPSGYLKNPLDGVGDLDLEKKESSRLGQVDPFGNPIGPAENPKGDSVNRPTVSLVSDQIKARSSSLRSNTFGSTKESIKDERLQGSEKPLPLVGEDGGEEPYAEMERNHEKDEIAKYLEAINENRKTMEMQSEKLQQRELKIKEQETKLRDAAIREKQHLTTTKELEEQVQSHIIRNAELERAWKKSTNALTRVQRGDSNYKVDDQTIKALYNELVFDVGSWTATYCTTDLRQRFNESDWRLLRSMTPRYLTYASHKRLRPLLVQSMLMKFLVRNVLSFSEDVGLLWAGRLCASLRQTKIALEPGENDDIPELLKSGELRPAEVREYSAWKAKSALLVSNAIDRKEVETNIEKLTSHLKGDLVSHVPMGAPQAWVDLKDIVRKAVKLDEEMNKSRALFTVHTWNGEDMSGSLRFNESAMESAVGFEAARPGSTVELVVAPALSKSGTADGDAFEATSYLSKWVILCVEGRKKV